MIGGGRGRAGGSRSRRRPGAGGSCSSTTVQASPTRPARGRSRCIAPAVAIGVYEGGLVPVAAGDVLYRFRAARIVVASGRDRAAARLRGQRPPRCDGAGAPSGGSSGSGRSSRGDARSSSRPSRRRRRRPRGGRCRGRCAWSICAARAHASSRRAAGSAGCASITVDGRAAPAATCSSSQAVASPRTRCSPRPGAGSSTTPARGVFLPAGLPPDVAAAGSVTGRGPRARRSSAGARTEARGSVSSASARTSTAKDVRRAVAEGFDSIELAKRYTTVTMGPCQGRLCHLAAVRLCARETGTDEARIGTTTARPPWQPVPLGLLAGRGHEPAKRTLDPPPPPRARRDDDVDRRWRRPHSVRRPGRRGPGGARARSA